MFRARTFREFLNTEPLGIPRLKQFAAGAVDALQTFFESGEPFAFGFPDPFAGQTTVEQRLEFLVPTQGKRPEFSLMIPAQVVGNPSEPRQKRARGVTLGEFAVGRQENLLRKVFGFGGIGQPDG